MNARYQALRDRWLERTIGDLARHDDRLQGLSVEIHVDGGVAHVAGKVASEDDRTRLREAVCSLRGVHAFWDGLQVADRSPLRVVDIGCGGTKQRAGSLGVDLWPAPGVDVLADLARQLPFREASLDRVYAVHVLEHVLDLVALMDRLHQALAPGGVLHVLSPHWQAVDAVADPTHVKYFDVQTFKWFCTRHGAALPWYPLHAGSDGASVFADLTPLAPGEDLADEDRLSRYFD